MSSHVTLKLLRLVLQGRLPLTELVRREHEHLLEVCSACRTEERTSREEAETLPWSAPPPPRWSALPEDLPKADRQVSFEDLERRVRLQQRHSRQRKLARRHLTHLLQSVPEDRAEVVEGASSRFRSRAFAELLLAESQRLVRSQPAEAENLASLVPLVVYRIPDAAGTDWAHDIVLLGLAWKANAQRIGGDLQAAVRTFAGLNSRYASRPASNPRVRGELAGLEAALRIDQRRTSEAQELLARGAREFRAAKDSIGVAKTLLQRSNLAEGGGQIDEALLYLEEAEASLSDVEAPSYLHQAVLTSRILLLCDLDRVVEADTVFAAATPTFDLQDPYQSASLSVLDGRIGLAAQDHSRAERSFLLCRESFLQIDRYYDAALVSLDLAQVYLESGRYQELEQLAADLVPQFQARGVGRETLAALRLLAEAVAARQLTGDLLRRLRDRMQGRTRPTADS